MNNSRNHPPRREASSTSTSAQPTSSLLDVKRCSDVYYILHTSPRRSALFHGDGIFFCNSRASETRSVCPGCQQKSVCLASLSELDRLAALQPFLFSCFCSVSFWCKLLIASAPTFVQHGCAVERDVDTAILGSELVVADSAGSYNVEFTSASLRDTADFADFATSTLAAGSSHAQLSSRTSSRSSSSSSTSPGQLQGRWRALRHDAGLQIHPPEDRGAVGMEPRQGTRGHGHPGRDGCPSQQTWHGRVWTTPSFARTIYRSHSHSQRRRDRSIVANTEKTTRGQHRR